MNDPVARGISEFEDRHVRQIVIVRRMDDGVSTPFESGNSTIRPRPSRLGALEPREHDDALGRRVQRMAGGEDQPVVADAVGHPVAVGGTIRVRSTR